MPPRRESSFTTIVTAERAMVVLNMPCFSMSEAMRPGIMYQIMLISKENSETKKYDFSTKYTPKMDRRMESMKRRLP